MQLATENCHESKRENVLQVGKYISYPGSWYGQLIHYLKSKIQLLGCSMPYSSPCSVLFRRDNVHPVIVLDYSISSIFQTLTPLFSTLLFSLPNTACRRVLLSIKS